MASTDGEFLTPRGLLDHGKFCFDKASVDEVCKYVLSTISLPLNAEDLKERSGLGSESYGEV